MLYAVEFQTRITNGIIEVPESYRQQLSGAVRVIILSDAPAHNSTTTAHKKHSSNLITQLLEHPRKIDDFAPLAREDVYERS